MNAPTPETGAITVTLAAEEKTAILDLLAQSLGETRIEVHRTHTPEFREDVLHHEALIRRLIEKLLTASA